MPDQYLVLFKITRQPLEGNERDEHIVVHMKQVRWLPVGHWLRFSMYFDDFDETDPVLRELCWNGPYDKLIVLACNRIKGSEVGMNGELIKTRRAVAFQKLHKSSPLFYGAVHA